MDEWENLDSYTERVLWALYYRTRAATIATIMGCTRLGPDIVIPIIERLAEENQIFVYRSPGQPALYFLRSPRSRDMLKTRELMQCLLWDLPLDDRVI